MGQSDGYRQLRASADWCQGIIKTEWGNTPRREAFRRATLISLYHALDRANPRLQSPVWDTPQMGDPEPGRSLDEDAQRLADLTVIGDEERRATVLRRSANILMARAREHAYQGRKSDPGG